MCSQRRGLGFAPWLGNKILHATTAATYTHTHTHTQRHTHTDTRTNAHTHSPAHTYTQTHTQPAAHTQTHIDTHRHTVLLHTHRRTHTHTVLYTHTCTHIDPHRHTQSCCTHTQSLLQQKVLSPVLLLPRAPSQMDYLPIALPQPDCPPPLCAQVSQGAGLPGRLSGEASACSAGAPGSIPRSGRSPGE